MCVSWLCGSFVVCICSVCVSVCVSVSLGMCVCVYVCACEGVCMCALISSECAKSVYSGIVHAYMFLCTRLTSAMQKPPLCVSVCGSVCVHVCIDIIRFSVLNVPSLCVRISFMHVWEYVCLCM